MEKEKFKFIDLFAGIGGFHLAMHKNGGKCVFASEIDKFARETYEHNFKKISPELFEEGMFNEDIRSISPENIPDFDILCGGFPCQSFSQIGQRKGFSDNSKSERGNLFFNIADIISVKKPKAFFLENVRGLLSHDKGNTFNVIQNMLRDELGYSLYCKVVKAVDYGLPQLRPRLFMIGFKDDSLLGNFEFPEKIPLKLSMSDIFKGKCSREIGFTLRVGGRGSGIDDRRNWDSYLVNNEVKRLTFVEGRKMQGFPDNFEFPVTKTQAMKQLGNSVAVDAIKECGKSMIQYLDVIDKRNLNMEEKKNKGEWTELYSLLKLINDRELVLANSDLSLDHLCSRFHVSKVTTLNLDKEYILNEQDNVLIKDKSTGTEDVLEIKKFINNDTLKYFYNQIKNTKGSSFSIEGFDVLKNKLGITISKGGNSSQKADIVLDINNRDFELKENGFGIKSYLGSSPTLLNASSNTNFLYKITGLDHSFIDEINAINSGQKIKARLNAIKELGGHLEFHKIESDSMDYNLNMVDHAIPGLMSEMLLEFYINRTNNIVKNLTNVYNKKQPSNNFDLTFYEVKIKRLLTSILLGFFAGKNWDGIENSKGVIAVKKDGSQVGFHIIEREKMESYLYNNIKFDTPSTTRHRYASLIKENDGNLYFKLNLQLRFK